MTRCAQPFAKIIAARKDAETLRGLEHLRLDLGNERRSPRWVIKSDEPPISIRS
ncbi:MAG: hypothetical protein L0H83_11720 [Salinisphaera sp.]|nr:hypothetical protein [Salinisphaera sp.]